MDEAIRHIWNFCFWIAGVGGTFMLAMFGWLISIHNRVGIREDVHKTLEVIKVDLHEIRKSLIGDYDKKGLLSKYHDLEDRVRNLEVRA